MAYQSRASSRDWASWAGNNEAAAALLTWAESEVNT